MKVRGNPRDVVHHYKDAIKTGLIHPAQRRILRNAAAEVIQGAYKDSTHRKKYADMLTVVDKRLGPQRDIGYRPTAMIMDFLRTTDDPKENLRIYDKKGRIRDMREARARDQARGSKMTSKFKRMKL